MDILLFKGHANKMQVLFFTVHIFWRGGCSHLTAGCVMKWRHAALLYLPAPLSLFIMLLKVYVWMNRINIYKNTRIDSWCKHRSSQPVKLCCLILIQVELFSPCSTVCYAATQNTEDAPDTGMGLQRTPVCSLVIAAGVVMFDVGIDIRALC